MSIIKAELFSTTASILIDVLNLGEQLGIYFAQQAGEIDEMKQRQFFFILMGISAINLFKSMFHNEQIKIGISFLIEIGELLSYLFILERTLAVMIISLTFFGLQFVCYIITFSLVKPDDETQIPEHRLKGFLYYLSFFISTNTNPLVTLFLNSESRFRQTLYEMSAIIGIFLSSMIYEIPMDVRSVMNTWVNRIRVRNETGQASSARPVLREVKKNNIIEHGWAIGNYLVSRIFSYFYMSILIAVLASLELKEKGSQLPSYDRACARKVIEYESTELFIYISN
ncbi:unnamed protein product [Adineta steineri]|uniref:Uncharacterized protein n=1 Tax=Adineta steineri TaxID=433720 RepID=A0A819N2C1_9BILA|nr:unnamed protein product [Adineta steineri]CAF3991139.1 unnamed protein product [Adineta steineri]